VLQNENCRSHGWQAGCAATGRAPVIAMPFTFNLFTILGPVHEVAPDLSEDEIRKAYDALIARDGLLPNPSLPLDKVETVIRDVIVRLAREQQSPGLS
jgi:hypothetical protein